MSTVRASSIYDKDGGSNAVLYGVASPSGGMNFRNRIINGDMRIDQRNAGASITMDGNGVYPVDRWRCDESSDGGATAQRIADAPDGFINSIKITTTTADASLAAAQYMAANQFVEGFNTADLMWGTANAKTITLSFWVKSSLTGTFAAGIDNNAGNRSYVFTYTISSANTWEYKTVTIAGDTTGTWNTDNSRGLGLRFGLGSGTDYHGTAGSWQTGSKFSTSGAVSVIGTLNATWQITGVQLEVGSVATPFERRPYGTELALCQRYCFFIGRSTNTSAPIIPSAAAIGSTEVFGFLQFPVTMRSAPTSTQTGTLHFRASSGAVALSVGSLVSVQASTTGAMFNYGSLSVTGGQAGYIRDESGTGAGYITVTAEL